MAAAEGDPQNLAQDRNYILGKILRIDPLGTNSSNGRYGIPSTNPFVGQPGLPEIWAYGLRNPQRFHWDRGGSGRLFIADIGQGVVEEIDLGLPGANYGWNAREGSYEYLGGAVSSASKRGDSATTGFTYPIAEYDHGEGSAVTAGFVYRGTALPGLDGKFLFGDIARGRVFFIDADSLPDGGQDPITELRLRYRGTEMSFLNIIRIITPSASRTDLRFGSDAVGAIYLLNKQDGIVRKLTPPPITITSLQFESSHFNIRFTTDPGLSELFDARIGGLRGVSRRSERPNHVQRVPRRCLSSPDQSERSPHQSLLFPARPLNDHAGLSGRSREFTGTKFPLPP